MKKNSLVLLSATLLTGGALYYYYYYQKKHMMKQAQLLNNQNEQQSMQEESKQQQQNKKQNNCLQTSMETPQPFENQPNINLDGYNILREKIQDSKYLTEQIVEEYLLVLRENLFIPLYELGKFSKDISQKLKNAPAEEVSGSLQEKIEIDGFKTFCEKVLQPNQKSINLSQSMNEVNKIQNLIHQCQKKSFRFLNIAYNKDMITALEEKIKQFSECGRVKQLSEEIQNLYQEALKGKMVNLECELPSSLTPELFLQVKKQIMMKQCQLVQKTFFENPKLYHLHGEIQIRDQAVQTLIVELDFSEIPTQIFQSHFVSLVEDIQNNRLNVDKVLAYAAETFAKDNKQFEQKLKRLQNIYDFTFEACIFQSENQGIIEELFDRFQI